MKRIERVSQRPAFLEHLEARLLLSAPAATLQADDITTGGTKAYSFVVEYTSDQAIDLRSLDSDDIRVTGPNGYSRSARLMSVIKTDNPLAVSAVYRIEAPGGTWNPPDDGAYEISLNADEVANDADELNAAAVLGTVNVSAQGNSLAIDTPRQLGTLTELTILTNLDTVLVPTRRIEFQMTGTGTKNNFIQLDSADEEAATSIALYRRFNGKLEQIKDASRNENTFNADDTRSRRISLKDVPAGTYVIEVFSSGNPDDGDRPYTSPNDYDAFLISRRNPHFSVAINPATDPSPDLLAATITTTNVPETLVPGETFNAKVKYTNIGDGRVKGSVNVELYFSTDATLDDSDTLIGTNAVTQTFRSNGSVEFEHKSNNISLKTDKSKTVTVKATVPSNLPEGEYFVIAKVQTNGLIPEVSTANNEIATATPFDLVFGFGAIAGREGVVMKYLEADGTEATLKLTGPGFGTLTFNAGVPSILLRNTTTASKFSITTKRGLNAWTIDDLTVGDGGDPPTSIGSITALTTTLLGAATASGTIGSAKFENVTLP